MKKYCGILRIAFDTQIFEQYANRFPDSHIYVYLNQCLIYQTEQGKPSTNLHQYIDSSTHLDTPMISLNEKDHNVVSIFFSLQWKFLYYESSSGK